MLKSSAKAAMAATGRKAGGFFEVWENHPRIGRLCWLAFDIAVTLGCLMVGVYYQSFAENPDRFLTLPFQHTREMVPDELNLDDLRGDAFSPRRYLYLFVLDCSRSVSGALDGVPSWYYAVTQELRTKQYRFRTSDPPTAYGVSKVATYRLLDSLLTGARAGGESGVDFEFAIWDVCGGSAMKVPLEGSSATVSRATLDRAITELEKERDQDNHSDDTTNFLELLKGIIGTYGVSGEAGTGTDRAIEAFQDTMFVVPVISDFKDDPDGLGTRDQASISSNRHRLQFFAERERSIKEATRSLTAANIMFNVVGISSDSSPAATNLLTLIKSRLRLHRYNQIDIMDDLDALQQRLLYPVHVVGRAFRFWYSDPLEVNGEILLEVPDGEDLGLAVPLASDGPRRFGVEVGRSSAKGASPKIEALLLPGDDFYLTGLAPGSNVVIRYLGPLPEEQQMLRVVDPRQRLTYLVPIQFVRRLPKSVAVHMSALIAFLVALCLFVVLFGILAQPSSGRRWARGIVMPRRGEERMVVGESALDKRE